MLGSRRLVYQVCRWTSLGPPPSPPPIVGSFSHKYDTFLAKYPMMHALHNRVVNGSRWCVMDVKQLWALRSIDLKDNNQLDKLTIPQLETLIQVRCEIPKVTAIMILLPLPLTVYVIGFAIIFFPRLILTRHFWTKSQREEFFLSDINKCVEAAKSLTTTSLPSKIEELNEVQKAKLSKLYGGFLPWSVNKLKERYLLTHNIDSRLDVSSLNRDQLIFHLFLRRVPYVIDEDDDSLRKRLANVIQKGESACSPVEYLTSTLRSL
ncbi:hypothetical protein PRIPAC_83153 [Pristionchus pacificus]|uniref:Letm1 RBD domain-containing protein n=1 Tax=Pristionchus pacificus TaxID=54126 RepID=A0A8R1Z7Y0_PRIPA|nr:hypothetical protein PRIPAC_83153 [Pristionchus pacificus]